MGEWCKMVDMGESASGKTKIWRVEPKDGETFLGRVSWYAPWRKYAFSPWSGTLYEPDCLRQIANFCELQTKAHRSSINAVNGN